MTYLLSIMQMRLKGLGYIILFVYLLIPILRYIYLDIIINYLSINKIKNNLGIKMDKYNSN